MTAIKNSLWMALGAAIVFALGWVAINFAAAHPSSVFYQTTAGSTTTVSFMTPGTATTTYQFDSSVFSASSTTAKVPNMETIDSGSLYVLYTASTSAGTLTWQYQCSNNNIDWYNADNASSTIGSAVSSTTGVVVPISTCVTAHERVNFSIPVTATAVNGSVYAEVDLKQLPANP